MIGDIFFGGKADNFYQYKRMITGKDENSFPKLRLKLITPYKSELLFVNVAKKYLPVYSVCATDKSNFFFLFQLLETIYAHWDLNLKSSLSLGLELEILPQPI